MRYSVYKQLIGVTTSMVEAMLYIKENLKAINLLVDCMEGITTIKKTLEVNGIQCCNEIDSFLQVVNEVVTCIEANNEYESKIEELYELSLRINKYCKKEIKYKFKIVFFAELGSKWDSMDSVYRAYKARNDCDVSVVLAPIYRAIKLPTGEIRSDVIYKDYLTEMGIEHILFKDYDIKKDMPDIVFTSQPYESVTSEQFWAENIAPYTRLVYLPYFTPNEAVTNEQKIAQTQLPIYKLAWKVVCHSNKVKEYYSKYFENSGNNILACGLPKWDYVVNINNREIERPKEWEKLKGKKVILRNFHFSTTAYFDEVIAHIRRAIEKEFGDDFAFIYRFHPMMETIVKVYFPENKKKWDELKIEVSASDNVVIDVNETYDCAFKFSDILITGFTSLISQYILTKKPAVVLFWDKYKEILDKEKLDGYFVKYSNLYSAINFDNALEITKKILDNDYDYEKRMKFIEEYLPSADGRIGERLATQLISELLDEDNML